MRILLLTLALACGLWGQATSVDCTPGYNTFTSATTGTSIPNPNTAIPCNSWGITYDSTGFSAFSLQFETSPDNVTFTAVTNSICSSSVNPPCVLFGTNPSTVIGGGMLGIRAYGRYVRINVTSVTGSGTIHVRIYGYKGLSANGAGGGSGGGGGGGGLGPTWVEASCDTPRTQTLAGNSFWSVVALTNWDAGNWQFLPAVDGKIYCTAQVPRSISGTPAATVLLETASANTASSKAVRWIVSTQSVPNGTTFNGSFTAETAQNISQSTTAYTRTDVTFTLTNQPAASDLLVIEVFRQGSNGGDTLTTLNALVFKVLLGINTV